MFKDISGKCQGEGAPPCIISQNYVTVNDCANILLACGGSPIMADDRRTQKKFKASAAA